MALVVVKPQTVSTTGAFTRASSATRVNASGLIESVGVDVLRLNYDPLDLSAPPGVLVEDAATNLLLYSEQFNVGPHGNWQGSITPNATTAPDGALSADKFVENATVNGHSTNYNLAVTSGVIYAFSVFVKAAERTKAVVALAVNNGAFNGSAMLVDLTLGTASVLAGSPLAYGVTDYGNGWFRCYVTSAAILTTTGVPYVGAYKTSEYYAGDGSSGIFVWGAQLEVGSTPTSYIPTTSAAATRAADVLTGTGIIATDVPENDYAAYNAGTTYALGDRVILVSTHTVYESLQASNTGHDPSLAASATWWLAVRPTNRWSLFDTSNTTATAQATSAYYLLQPGSNINTLAVTGLANCTGARVQQIHPTQGTVYDQSRQLYPAPSAPDWFSWFMLAHESVSTQAVFDDLYPWPDTAVVISLVGGADLACANLVVGYQTEVGYGIEYGAKIGIQDYSRIVTNTHGDTVLEQRAYAKRMAFSLKVPNEDMDLVIAYLESIRATPVLWIGSNQYESTVIFGFYQDWDLVIAYPNHSAINANIQGMS